MKRLQAIGSGLFAVGLAGLGSTHLIFGDFMTGRAPAWPEAVPGRELWAYGTGAFLILAALAILTGRRVRTAMLATGILIFAWAMLRNLPVLAADTLLGGAWTRTGKGLALFGGAFAIAGIAPAATTGSDRLRRFIDRRREFVRLGSIGLGLFLLVSGIQHFMFTGFVATLFPAWFPGDPIQWARVGGVALIAGGGGLLVPVTSRLAALGSGLMIFSWVWIIHLPRALGAMTDRIAIFEALAFSGIAFVLASSRD